MVLTRRQFLSRSAAAGVGLFLVSSTGGVRYVRATSSSTAVLAAGDVPKYLTPLLVPPVMPRAAVRRTPGGKTSDYYEISMQQLTQQVLPAGLPMTTVWGYGAVTAESRKGLLLHHAPSLTIEARWNRPVLVKWINELVDRDGNYRPHLLPVDPTLHWANPAGGATGRDMRPVVFPAGAASYTGPVPMVTHLHGAVAVQDYSDGYPEAWYLPRAGNIADGYATEGTWYDFFRQKAEPALDERWGPGYAVFAYPNANRASTLWYHDHTLGMTRLNVYAGPAGFYLVRGGPDDVVTDTRTGSRATLPGPAPEAGDPFPARRPYFEIPIAIQDRAFTPDGSLFYPDSREYFDGLSSPYRGESDDPEAFPPIWNPEFFGNTIMVNGATWPYLTVQQRRYRFRFLNGCDSRFLIVDFAAIPGVDVWQIGNEGGFLAQPFPISAEGDNRLLLGLAERADIIVDFTNVPIGEHVLRNAGPDAPFGGGDFDPANPDGTGQIMQFRVTAAMGADTTTPPRFLSFPRIEPLPQPTVTRGLALIEAAAEGDDEESEPVEGPLAALLGIVDTGGVPRERAWMDAVSENPDAGATETWEFHNTTMDAHPMHIHEVAFQVVDRQRLLVDDEGEVIRPVQLVGDPRPPEPWESGWKDTVTAYPGEVTRVRARFATPGQFTWHCHIVSHEDNEMMRPFRIGPVQPGQPGS